MATFPEDFKSFLESSTALAAVVGTRVHYNHIPQPSARGHVWFRVSSDREERTFDTVGGLHEAVIDLEAVHETEAVVQTYASIIRTYIDGYQGAMGDSTAQGIFVEDHDDQYTPRSDMSDEGLSVAALNVRIFYTT